MKLKHSDLSSLSVPQLVDLFARIGLEEDEAHKVDDRAKRRRLPYEMRAGSGNLHRAISGVSA